MFNEIGKQLKKVAETIAYLWLFLYGIIAVITLMLTIKNFDSGNTESAIAYLIICILSCVIGFSTAWISGAFIYALGELVDSNMKILKNTETIAKKSAVHKPHTESNNSDFSQPVDSIDFNL